MHPAEHRALRELHATTKHVHHHWGRLAQRLGGAPQAVLEQGAEAAAQLLAELDTRIAGQPAAQTVGARLAGVRGVSDLLLERNQAFRAALLDLQHVTTLLGYTGALAGEGAWQGPWEERFSALEGRARAAINALASDPDSAIAPAEASTFGRAGAKLGEVVGTLGEAIDTRLARRRAT